MSSFAVPFEVRYGRRSGLRKNALQLVAAEDAKGQHKQFLSGTLMRPRHVAALLRLLMTVVQARYHIPSAMLNPILAEADPIFTSSHERLRFEELSNCRGPNCWTAPSASLKETSIIIGRNGSSHFSTCWNSRQTNWRASLKGASVC